MFDILMYLFENYMDGNITLNADEGQIVTELEQIGFVKNEIGRALDWLDGLNKVQATVDATVLTNPHAIRHYTYEESERLGLDAKGFLLTLEQMGILDAMTREVVLDRIMVLHPREVDLGRIKWVILIALFNQPNKKSALSLLQDMILSDVFDLLH